MDFGRYLAYGTSPILSHKVDAVQDQGVVSTAGGDGLPSVVLTRLEKCLRHMGLTPFSSRVLIQRIVSLLQGKPKESNPLSHVLPYLLNLIQPKPRDVVDGVDRKGCPQLIPALRANPYWDTSEFGWVRDLESNIETIRSEFLALRTSLTGFQRYRSADSSENTDSGSWHVCYLSLHGMDFSENALLCPKTMEIISSIPRFYHHAMFSALDKCTHVSAHYGPTNKKLRCFLPLFVPADDTCWLRVNHEKRYLSSGKCLIFDDSFYHEAANESQTEPRIVLILDVWHPDLQDEEVKILEFINKAQITAAKRLVKELEDEDESQRLDNGTEPNDHNFLSTIQKGKRDGIDEEDASKIWGDYARRHQLSSESS